MKPVFTPSCFIVIRYVFTFFSYLHLNLQSILSPSGFYHQKNVYNCHVFLVCHILYFLTYVLKFLGEIYACHQRLVLIF